MPLSATDSALRAFCSTSSTVRPSRRELAEHAKIRAAPAGARPERRLVEQQHLRPGHQRPADDQHLPLAAGQRVAGLRRAVLQRAGTARRPRSGRRVAPVARHSATEPQVLLHGQLGDHAAALGHVGQAAADDVSGETPASLARRADPAGPRARTSPEIARSSVVLPAPLAPSTAVIAAARATVEARPRRARPDRAVARRAGPRLARRSGTRRRPTSPR